MSMARWGWQVCVVNWVTYELYGTREFEAILQLTGKETTLTDAGIMRYSRSLYSWKTYSIKY